MRKSPELAEMLFACSACALFSITGLMKILSALSEHPTLASGDVVFAFLSNRQFLFLGGALELVIVVLILTTRNGEFHLSVIAGLAFLLVAYRVARWHAGISGVCGCLGLAYSWLGLAPTTTDNVAKGIVFFLLSGSVLLLRLRWGRTAQIRVAA